MWFGIIALWSLVGIFIIFLLGHWDVSLIENADGWEFVNPKIIYERVQVNWFGAIILSLFFNALCPIVSICYWFYKLCTVGRR